MVIGLAFRELMLLIQASCNATAVKLVVLGFPIIVMVITIIVCMLCILKEILVMGHFLCPQALAAFHSRQGHALPKGGLFTSTVKPAMVKPWWATVVVFYLKPAMEAKLYSP